MTRHEFKKFVSSKGVKETDTIGYIDFSCLAEEVEIQEDDMMERVVNIW